MAPYKTLNSRKRFSGTVDFSPERVGVPGSNRFPSERFRPGAIGDADYSPLITTNGRTVLNVSQVANSSGLHDAVVGIDRKGRQVTLDTFDGFYEDEPLQYLHQEGSVKLIAAIEGSTFAPNLKAAPKVDSNDKKISARSAIIPIVNGPRGSTILSARGYSPRSWAKATRSTSRRRNPATTSTAPCGTSRPPYGPTGPSRAARGRA